MNFYICNILRSQAQNITFICAEAQTKFLYEKFHFGDLKEFTLKTREIYVEIFCMFHSKNENVTEMNF